MKKEPISIIITTAIVSIVIALVSCSVVGTGMEGNIYEKMTIFSLIALTFLAIVLFPFLSNTDQSKGLSRYRELIRNAASLPLSADELTSYPVYVWDSRKSFRKLFFSKDGAFSESAIITTNGLDPKLAKAGTWEITPKGKLQLAHQATGSSKALVRISQNGYNLPTLMRLDSGYVEAWFFGENNLAKVQISCFGYSDSLPPAEKFTVALISGLTVFWATYPCQILTSSNEVTVNPELAYGVIKFHVNGTVSKSVNNQFDAVPDYKPAFTGSWKIDENFGVLNMSVGLYTTEVHLLLHSAEHHSLLVGTTAGTEQWFLDPEMAHHDLITHLALAVHLDAEKRGLFG